VVLAFSCASMVWAALVRIWSSAPQATMSRRPPVSVLTVSAMRSSARMEVRCQEALRHHDHAGERLPGDLHLMGQPRHPSGIGGLIRSGRAAQDASDDEIDKFVAERLDDRREPQQGLAGPHRTDEHADGHYCE
jgi:hypothetical protein